MGVAIVQFQKKQEAKFICSACGADRGCDCNAPAVEKLAEKLEQDRQRARKARDRKKILAKSNNASRDDFKWNEPLEEPCEDCNSPQEFWERSAANMAGEAISLRAYWTRQFGKWEKCEKPSHLATLARQAADEWNAIAEDLSRKATPDDLSIPQCLRRESTGERQ